MPLTIAVDTINLLPDSIEVVVYFSEESGPPYTHASVTVFVENRDWLLSDLKTDAIEKAKAFALQAASSRQS